MSTVILHSHKNVRNYKIPKLLQKKYQELQNEITKTIKILKIILRVIKYNFNISMNIRDATIPRSISFNENKIRNRTWKRQMQQN